MKFYLIALATAVLAAPQAQTLNVGLYDQGLLNLNLSALTGALRRLGLAI
jgi:hypothetical protein